MRGLAKPAYPAGAAQARPQSQSTGGLCRNQNRLIFVDDDDIYRNIVKAELADEGFFVLDFASGEEMLESLRTGAEADIAILDWGLEKTDGIDLLPAMREVGVDLPVVFLTGRCSPVHERLAFQRGAVDFIDKSRGTEILARR